MKRKPLVVLLAVLCCAYAPRALAEEDAATRRAKQHNAEAKKLFSLGRFEEAGAEYEKAYEAKPVPAFLFNLAQCYKRMGRQQQLERAIFYFKGYLKYEPFTPMRESIEKEIKKLEGEIVQLKRPAPFYKRWWFWAAIGGVIAASVGITVAATAPGDEKPTLGTVPEGYYEGI